MTDGTTGGARSSVGATDTAGVAQRRAPLRSPLWSRTWVRIAGGFVVPLVILAVWQFVTATGIVPPYRLPGPWSVVEAGIELIERGQLWLHIAISVQRVFIGFLFGSVIALAFAAVVGLSRAGAVLLAPLLILWFQVGEESKIILIAIGAFFPVYTTVADALRHVDPQLVEAGRTFGLRGWSLFRTVQLPAVVPSVVSGLRLGLAQAWLFLVAAELIAASMGLGWMLSDSQTSGRVDRILLSIVLLALLGTITNAILVVFEKAVLRRWM
jgi:sulfonate transport system permease protein